MNNIWWDMNKEIYKDYIVPIDIIVKCVIDIFKHVYTNSKSKNDENHPNNKRNSYNNQIQRGSKDNNQVYQTNKETYNYSNQHKNRE